MGQEGCCLCLPDRKPSDRKAEVKGRQAAVKGGISACTRLGLLGCNVVSLGFRLEAACSSYGELWPRCMTRQAVDAQLSRLKQARLCVCDSDLSCVGCAG